MSCGCHPTHDYKCKCGADIDYHIIVYDNPASFLEHWCKNCFPKRQDRGRKLTRIYPK